MFAAYFIAFPLRTLMAIFIVLLVVGPVVTLVLAFFMYRQSRTQNARWTTNLKGYGRFWLALLITIGLHVALVVGYLKLNPYVSLVIWYSDGRSLRHRQSMQTQSQWSCLSCHFRT